MSRANHDIVAENQGAGMDFVALDVETANADIASICQIGLVAVHEGAIADEWSTLVDPEDFFDGVNVGIHGITEDKVIGAPKFPEMYSRFTRMTADRIVISHTSFDRLAITRAVERYDLPDIHLSWLDSARIVRRTWPEKYRRKGYGLANVAADLGIEFGHHDALEDARAAALIVLKAIEATGLCVEDWLARAKQPIDMGSSSSTLRGGNPEGPLFGQVLVFTGALELPRHEAADLAAAAGCTVEKNVTKQTTLLVVGDQDIGRLGGHEKSSKHRKAEAMIAKGQSIRILRETDFRMMISLS